MNNIHICEVCGYVAKSGRDLMRHRSEFKHRKHSYCYKGYKMTDAEKKNFKEKLHKTWNKNNHTPTGIASTPEKEAERRKKISETMRKNKRCGGYRPGSGKAKCGWYKGFWCDSSWELAYTIYNLENNIKFQRNKKWFPYHNQNGDLVKYYPDYILPDGSYVEIKGRDSYQDWILKLKEFPKEEKLTVYNYWGMKLYLKYVISKYGKNFTDLYEKIQNETVE